MEQKMLTEERAEDLLERLRGAVEASSKATFDLCWLLHEVDRSVVRVGEDPVMAYEFWGYEDWFDFVEVEVGIHEQTANVYRKVGRVFGDELAGAWDSGDLLPIGKMAILAAWPGLSRRNVRSKMKWARDKTCCHMQEVLLGRERPVRMAFDVSASEQESINSAIKEARAQFDGGEEMTRGELVALMVKQWATVAKKKKPSLRAVG